MHSNKEFKISLIKLKLLKLSVMISSVWSSILILYHFDQFIYTCKIFTMVFSWFIHSSLISIYFKTQDSLKLFANIFESENFWEYIVQKYNNWFKPMLLTKNLKVSPILIWISPLFPLILCILNVIIQCQSITVYSILSSVFSILLIIILMQVLIPKSDDFIEQLQSTTDKLSLFKCIISKIPLPIFVTDLSTLHFVSK